MFADTQPKAEPGKQVAQTLTYQDADGKEQSISYWLYLPKDHKADGKKMPLMLFLHGAGERGDDLEKVAKHGPPKIVQTKKDFPFIVISPQCPKGVWWNTAENLGKLNKLVETIIDQQNVDTSRVYCTGLSMGGYGTWSLVAKYPGLFAAAVPICGGGDPDDAAALAKTPIWAFHGDADSVVPHKRSKEMVDAVNAAKGDVQLTSYPGVNHDSWTKTYNNAEVYKWLLSHTKKN
ncbi:MAG: phospholipase [Blastopirellula sp.]|nr:MAG: phospholipase [Blastopirellula sp.]